MHCHEKNHVQMDAKSKKKYEKHMSKMKSIANKHYAKRQKKLKKERLKEIQKMGLAAKAMKK